MTTSPDHSSLSSTVGTRASALLDSGPAATAWRNARTARAMVAMELRNRTSRARVVAPGGPVVSLTSYSARVDQVHLAIESIGRGLLRPSRLILWLDEEERLAHPPAALARLVARGLEIRRTPDYGPHKKYYPYVASVDDHRAALVTSDDDTLYPSRWLASLWEAHLHDGERVHAHRVHLITVTGDGVGPYRAWARATTDRVTARNFAVGVGGVLYPPAFLDVLREAGDGFLDVAPRADDVWLHSTLLRSGRRVRPVLELPGRDFLPVRGGGSVPGLFASNVDAGGNDLQIAATYGPEEVALILADA